MTPDSDPIMVLALAEDWAGKTKEGIDLGITPSVKRDISEMSESDRNSLRAIYASMTSACPECTMHMRSLITEIMRQHERLSIQDKRP